MAATPQELERRLAVIEQQIGMGMIGTMDGLRSQLEQQAVLLASLREEQVNGNVLGGMLRTDIGPGAFPIGPYRQDVDDTYALEFDHWIPEYWLRIKRCVIRLKPGPIRSSVAVSASASGELTSNSGGGSTSGSSSASTTGNGGAALLSAAASGATIEIRQTFVTETHNHRVLIYRSDNDHGWTGRVFDGHTISGNATEGVRIEAENAADIYTEDQHPLTASSSTSPIGVASATSHTHSVTLPDHQHGMTHTHSTPNHSHTIPTHDHELTLAIAEGGDAEGLRLYIDDVDRTTALGGPWDSEAELDIRQYLINARQMPVHGAHRIKVTSTSVGSVEVTGDMYGVLKAIR